MHSPVRIRPAFALALSVALALVPFASSRTQQPDSAGAARLTGLTLVGRLVIGGGWQTILPRTTTSDDYRARSSGDMASLDVGAILLRGRRGAIFPLAGVGATHLAIRIDRRGDFCFSPPAGAACGRGGGRWPARKGAAGAITRCRRAAVRPRFDSRRSRRYDGTWWRRAPQPVVNDLARRPDER